MDFVEGQEAVAVAAVVDEGGLERGLHACDLGEIDVAAQQLSGCAFEIEFLYPAVPLHHDPGLLGMRGIDEHFAVRHRCSFARRGEGGLPVRSEKGRAGSAAQRRASVGVEMGKRRPPAHLCASGRKAG